MCFQWSYASPVDSTGTDSHGYTRYFHKLHIEYTSSLTVVATGRDYGASLASYDNISIGGLDAQKLNFATYVEGSISYIMIGII